MEMRRPSGGQRTAFVSGRKVPGGRGNDPLGRPEASAAGGGRGEGEGLSSYSRAWKQVLQDHPRADGWERGL